MMARINFEDLRTPLQMKADERGCKSLVPRSSAALAAAFGWSTKSCA
jgi:hypothetical protein